MDGGQKLNYIILVLDRLVTNMLVLAARKGSKIEFPFVRLQAEAWRIDQVLTHENFLKTGDRCITQIANTTIDPKFVVLTADVRKFQQNMANGVDFCVAGWPVTRIPRMI